MTFLRYLVISTVALLSSANDIPSQPVILETRCLPQTAILSWSPTGDAPVTGYLIQYHTDWSPGEWVNQDFNTALLEKNVRIFLSPWSNYTFRVLSRNNAGVSLPSEESEVCTAEEDVPHKNPESVYGRGNGPNNLVISWKPMPPIDHNAPGFYYKVYWRQDNIAQESWHYRIVKEWQQHRLTIENLPKLKPFRIRVEAYNNHGKSNVDAVEMIGYSDEDKPSEKPNGFKVISVRDGRTVTLQWEPVSPISLNGHFKGYKIQSWTKDEENKREVIVPANSTTATVDIFSPGEVNNAHIFAYNGAFDGPPSDPIEITTPEDVYPDAPDFVLFRAPDQNGGPTVRVTIYPNITNNNPGKQIYIQYRKQVPTAEDNGDMNQWESTIAEDVEENSNAPLDLTGLDFDAVYEVRVVSVCGELSTPSNVSEINTGALKWPRMASTKSIEEEVPIVHTTTTTVAAEEEPYIEPVKEGNGDYNVPIDPPVRPSQQSAPVQPPQQPQQPVPIDNTNPENTNLELEGQSESQFSKTPWFIALICVLAFICAFIGLFIFIKRRRTGSSDSAGKKNSKRSPIDTVRPTALKTSDESNDNNRNVRVSVNGNVGHDDLDMIDDDYPPTNVYNPTTQKLQNV